MKIGLFVYNPKSGNSDIVQNMDYIVDKFQKKNILLNFYRIDSNASKLEDILKKTKYDLVIFSGGDGTINYGANLIMRYQTDTPMGVIPAGTCNDFANCINIPIDTREAVDTILEGYIEAVDIGVLNEKMYFLSTFAGGLFAGTAFDTNTNLKKSLGPFAYYLKGISEVVNLKTFNFSIKTENEEINENAVLFLIVNGKHAGGFKELVKYADLSDGEMDIIIIKECMHVDLTKLLFKVLTSDIVNDKNVRVLKAKECEIRNVPENISMTVDGEKWEDGNIKIKFLNKKLKVFVHKPEQEKKKRRLIKK